MRPILFYVGSVAIRSYDAVVALSMIAGLSLIYWRARSAGLSGRRVLAGGVSLILVGIAGSRIGNVLIDLKHYISDWRAIFSLHGTGFQGGLIAGVLAAFLVARYLRISFWKLTSQQ